MKRNGKSGRTQTAAEPVTRPESQAGITELATYVKQVRETASNADAFEHTELAQVIEILETLQAEGIRSAEEIKDYFFDYRLATEQWRNAYEKYEKPEQVNRVGGMMFCPLCKAKAYPGNKHCGQCGKALSGT